MARDHVDKDGPVPRLLTAGRIAAELDEPLHRVLNVLSTRNHIRPAARGGTLRLYPRSVIVQVRRELDAIDEARLKGGRQ